jgi:hypothetical protein
MQRHTKMSHQDRCQMIIDIMDYYDANRGASIRDAQEHFEDTYNPVDVRDMVLSMATTHLIIRGELRHMYGLGRAGDSHREELRQEIEEDNATETWEVPDYFYPPGPRRWK